MTKVLKIKDEVFDLIVQTKSKEQIEFIKQEGGKNKINSIKILKPCKIIAQF